MTRGSTPPHTPPTNPTDQGALPAMGSSTAASAPRTPPPGSHCILHIDTDAMATSSSSTKPDEVNPPASIYT
jgi:hypothetical protein